MKSSFFLLPALLAATAAVHAAAPGHPDPADAAQPGAMLPHRSAFDHYPPYEEPPSPSLERWREANDEVGRLGGHAGHVDAADAPVHDHSGHAGPSETAPTQKEGHDHAH